MKLKIGENKSRLIERMDVMRRVTSVLLISAFLIASAMAEQPPVNIENTITTASRVMTYQGILKDNAGDPVGDGDYNIIFRIYDAPSGGNLLWMETVTSSTHDGYFGCQLGLSSPISLPFNADYYLAIQIQGDSQMADRQRVTLSPYSARCDTAETAINADQLDGQHAASFASSGHNHDAAYVNEGQSNSINSIMISDGTVSSADILDGTIATADIQNSTILFNDIAQNGATTNQVMKWNGSAWVAMNDSIGQNYWTYSSSILSTSINCAINKGQTGNNLFGVNAFTHINLGNASETGTIGSSAGYCVVGGGFSNKAVSSYSTVAGGINNVAYGFSSAIAGGQQNYAGAMAATVAGGWADSVKSVYGGIISGYLNLAGAAPTDTGAIVGGGVGNRATAKYCFIGGGLENTATGLYSFVGGGQFNTASGTNATVSGGYGNLCASESSAIPGGYCDTIASTGYKSMVFGTNVYNSVSYRVVFFDSLFNGSLNINRDGRDGTVYSYPIQVGTNTSNGNGAYLTSAGVWTNGSSRTFKENFQPMDGSELLSKISNLSIVSYNYKNSTEKHFGPMAEDFVGAFDTGVIREDDGKRDDMYLSSGDVAGVALAGVQELIEQNKTLLEKIDKLEKRISELENR
jgi:hypothetical protein